MSKTKLIPYRGWYLVFAICEHEKLGSPTRYSISPDWRGPVQFDQYYMAFTEFSDMINNIPIQLPNILWLLPNPNPDIYPQSAELKNELDELIISYKDLTAKRSEFYCAISNNDVGSIILQISEFNFEDFYYDETSGFFRLWLLLGDLNFVFTTPIVRNFNITYENHLSQIVGKIPVPKATVETNYIAHWLGSDEGF